MEAIDSLGLFWLQGRDDDKLSGRLVFDPEERGIRLSLVGAFQDQFESGNDVNSRILGWIGHRQVTLNRCFPSKSSNPSPGVAETSFLSNELFVGAHIEADPMEFQTATISFSDMENWVGKTGLTHHWQRHTSKADGEHADTYYMSYTPPTEDVCEFSRGSIRISYAWNQAGDALRKLSFEQWPNLRLEYSEPQSFEVIRSDVGRINALLTLCMDTSVAIDKLLLTHPLIPAVAISGEPMGHPQPVEFLAQPLRYSNPAERNPHHQHRMFLSYEELGGIAQIARWIDSAARFQRSLDSLMSIKHARQIFTENRFLNVAYAAEAFHVATLGGKQMEEEQFSKLLSTYIEATPHEHREWLESRIEHGNVPTFKSRLMQLAERAGEGVRPMIGNRSQWAYTLSRTRNELTHLGAMGSYSGGDLYYLAESLYTILRSCMLLELGAPTDTLNTKVCSDNVMWMQERIQSSLANVVALHK